jgi:hypothetical protein
MNSAPLFLNEGDGAFYGQARFSLEDSIDVLAMRNHSADYHLPKPSTSNTGKDGEKTPPVMIHRVVSVPSSVSWHTHRALCRCLSPVAAPYRRCFPHQRAPALYAHRWETRLKKPEWVSGLRAAKEMAKKYRSQLKNVPYMLLWEKRDRAQRFVRARNGTDMVRCP